MQTQTSKKVLENAEAQFLNETKIVIEKLADLLYPIQTADNFKM